jgi:hypothetical protein
MRKPWGNGRAAARLPRRREAARAGASLSVPLLKAMVAAELVTHLGPRS